MVLRALGPADSAAGFGFGGRGGSSLPLPGPGGPLPESVGDLLRKAVPQLTGGEYDLTAVMGLVRYEVRHDVSYIEGQVPPRVCLRCRNLAAGGKPELEELFDAPSASLQRGHQARPGYSPKVHQWRRCNAKLGSERPDPAASSVMEVGSESAQLTGWNDPGHRRVPQRSGYCLDQA